MSDTEPVITVGDLAQLPVNRVERSIDRWGIPTVLLIVMSVVFYQLYTGKLQLIQDAQASTQKAMEQHINDMRLDQSEIRFFLRAMCNNAADSEAERANCVPPSQAR
jgi:hypothetical protein